MNDWERFGDWIGTLAVASVAWLSSAIAPELPADSTTAAGAAAENQQSQMMSWAQQDDDPTIEQVGEGAGDDAETLDEASPRAEVAETNDDIELLDQGAPLAVQTDDLELLDQGAPAVTESTTPSTVTVAPATYVVPDPVATSGPALPEGFGTGRVHVSAGRSGFPVALDDCHVGAVTGRAYVGIDCGDGSSFVGHAPSFEDFPFVLDESFPFGEDSVFAERAGEVADDDLEILVSASRGTPRDDDETAPEIQTSGNSSVQLAQQAREREPRVEAESRGSKRNKDSKKGETRAADAAEADDGGNRARAENRDKKQSRNKDKNSRASAGDNENDSKNAKKSKKQGGKKSKKERKSENR